MKQFIAVFSFIAMAFGNTCNAVTLDVLVVYSQQVEDQYGASLEGEISNRIEWTNSAFESSDVDIKLNLVGSDLLELPNNHEVSSKLLNSLYKHEDLLEIANVHKPDLTVYLTHASSDYCGYAKTFPIIQKRLYSQHFPFHGISVVGVDCQYSVFAHEIGHNLGAAHSKEQGEEGYPIRPNRGYGVFGEFVTVMAYRSAFGNAPTLQNFSNPDNHNCHGLRCGVPSSSDAAQHMEFLAKEYVHRYSGCYPTKISKRKHYCQRH